jgi:chondroitin 4-sulfotransferase 11
MNFDKRKVLSSLLTPIIGAHNCENLINFIRDPYSKWEDELECIFIHVPKAAGKSVSKALLGAPNGTGHNKMYCYERNKQKFSKYKKITVVRNPWDRLVSAFHYIKQFDKASNDRIFFDKYIGQDASFEIFLMRMKDAEYSKKIMEWEHFTPQVEFLRGSNGDIDFDFIARFESLENDYKTLMGIVNPRASVLNKINASDHSYYKKHYTEEMVNIVATLYEQDIRAFNYSY